MIVYEQYELADNGRMYRTVLEEFQHDDFPHAMKIVETIFDETNTEVHRREWYEEHPSYPMYLHGDSAIYQKEITIGKPFEDFIKKKEFEIC